MLVVRVSRDFVSVSAGGGLFEGVDPPVLIAPEVGEIRAFLESEGADYIHLEFSESLRIAHVVSGLSVVDLAGDAEIVGAVDGLRARAGSAVPEIDPQPVVTASQVAELAVEPVFDAGRWVLRWSVREKTAQELADELSAWREAEVVSRTQFASACFIAGIIAGQEARDWAGGNALPANVEAAIVAAISDPAEQVVALTKAGAEINVRRNNILIDILAADASFDMSDVEVDQIFALAKWVD